MFKCFPTESRLRVEHFLFGKEESLQVMCRLGMSRLFEMAHFVNVKSRLATKSPVIYPSENSEKYLFFHDVLMLSTNTTIPESTSHDAPALQCSQSTILLICTHLFLITHSLTVHLYIHCLGSATFWSIHLVSCVLFLPSRHWLWSHVVSSEQLNYYYFSLCRCGCVFWIKITLWTETK